MRLIPRTASAGLSLLELVVAIAILAIGTIAALRATDQSRLAIGGETPRLIARIAARNRAEELQLLGLSAPLPRSVTLGGQQVALDVRTAATAAGLTQATVTARAASGEGVQLVVYLPPPGLRR